MNTIDTIITRFGLKAGDVEQKGNAFLINRSKEEFVDFCERLYMEFALPLKTMFASDERTNNGCYRVFCVFGLPEEHAFIIPILKVREGEAYPSITSVIHEASGYERKIHTFFGLVAEGHPALGQIILQDNWPEGSYPLRKDFAWDERPEEAKRMYDFHEVEGEGVYEIPVGPVHAGIIEPGHFRFSVAGEEILLLEPRLGYTHKGAEKLFERCTAEEGIRLAERISGDTSFTHALAYCQAIERMANVEVSERASYLRVIFSELERIANHLNDIGFVMLDTGFSFGGSQCARLRERIMQINEKLSGSRFLRGLVTIGGVARDLAAKEQKELLKELKAIRVDFSEVIEIANESSSLLNRLITTGRLDRQIADDHGAIGIAGRAVGIAHDARKEYPYAAYEALSYEMALEKDGDVMARWMVRIKEVYSSIALIEKACSAMPKTGALFPKKSMALPLNGFSVGIAEGWRGDIVYTILTDGEGHLDRIDVRDPSFLNWNLAPHAVKGNIVPDFPLINKSFNLSYSGYDV